MSREEATEAEVVNLPARKEKAPILAGGPVRAIVPQTIEDAYRIAQYVVAADLAPRDMKKPEQCLVAIMHGLEVGMPPMQALQRIAVINGRPTIWGDAAMGLVRASGRCESVKEWFSGDGDEFRAHCEVKRKGDPHPIGATFSVKDAVVAGLWNKPGPWKQFPRRMLQMRARGFCLRDGFADVLGGMYLAEEMEDDREVRDVTPGVPAWTPPEPPGEPSVGDPVVRPSTEGRPARGAARGSQKAKPYAGGPVVEHEAPTGLRAPMSNDEADQYLADLAQRLEAAPAIEDVLIIREEYAELHRAHLFPPDRTKAEKLLDAGEARFSE